MNISMLRSEQSVSERAFDMLTRARTNMLINSSFFGSLAMRLKLTEDESIGTFAVDGVSVFYNPEFVLSLSLGEVKTVLAHEVLHVLLGHHERRGTRDAYQWNMAADYALNPLLDDDPNYVLPDGALLDSRYKGKSAEEIYGLLQRNGGSSSGQKGKGGNSGQGSGTPQKAEKAGSENPLGSVLDKPKNAPVQASSESWKGAAVVALRKDSKAGKAAAAIAELVGELVNPSIPWEQVLRSYMTSISKDDFSWARPNRRFIGSGIYLPCAYSEQLGEVVIAIDVSGSVDTPSLRKFLSEVKSILGEVSYESVRVIQCNIKITKDEVFYPDDEMDIAVKGGGGTRFIPVFDAIDGTSPDVLLYFTDLAIPRSMRPEDPGYPVLWVEPKKTSAYRLEPKFGEVVKIA